MNQNAYIFLRYNGLRQEQGTLDIHRQQGDGIYEKLSAVDKKDKKEYIGVWQHKGGTIRDLAAHAETHLKNYPFDIAYIAGGACDVTSKDRVTNKIFFPWSPPSRLGKHLCATVKELDAAFAKSFPASKVIFCPLVGTDLSRVVTAHTITDDQQAAVDDAMFELNEEIFRINLNRGNFAPALHRTIHRSRKKSYYEHLSDGLHLTDYIKDKWVTAFVKAASAN